MKKKCVFFAFIILSLSACDPQTKVYREEQTKIPESDSLSTEKEAIIHYFKVTLRQKNGKSVLLYKNKDHEKEVNLLIPWPVDFHKNKDGNVREVSIKDTIYFMVESSSPDSILTKRCRTHLQSVKLKGKDLSVSAIQETVAACPPFQ